MSGGVLAVVPARAGSRRLPGKNMLELAGRPLIAWTLDLVVASPGMDACCVSSDDESVLALAAGYPGIGVVRRPPELATDQARNVDVMRHVVASMARDFERIVLLQPTCPLRLPEDVMRALDLHHRSGAVSCITVCEAATSSYHLFEQIGGRLSPLVERPSGADIRDPGPSILRPNGAVFVIRTDALMAGEDFYSTPPVPCEMPAERSIDIDDGLDFALAEFFLTRRMAA